MPTLFGYTDLIEPESTVHFEQAGTFHRIIPFGTVVPTTVKMSAEIREWYYSDVASGVQKGPVPAVVLNRLLEKGVGVSPQTLVWKAGMEQWLPAANVSISFLCFAVLNFLNIVCIAGGTIPNYCEIQRNAMVLH